MDRLIALKSFARVAETKSFSAAAVQLGLAKSVVSKQIARLEDSLGLRLFHRTTRRLSLTEAGARLLESAQRILAELETAETLASEFQAAPRGRLRINVPMSFGIHHIAPAIADFCVRYPDIQIDMDLTDRFVDLVNEGYDLAVRIAEIKDTSLIARRLAPSRMVMAASPAYLKRHGRPKKPNDLGQHVCLGYSGWTDPFAWRLRINGRTKLVKVKGPYAANNGEAVLMAAEAGLGITIGPTFILGDAIRAGRLETLMSDYLPTGAAVYAVYPSRRHIAPKLRAFVDFLGERFGPEPYWDQGLFRRVKA